MPIFIDKQYIPATELLLQRWGFCSAGVNRSNPYVLATIQGSLEHPQSSHEMDAVARKVGGFIKPHLLKATKVRHKKSSVINNKHAHTMKEVEKEALYDHFRHDSKVNRHVYQAPLATKLKNWLTLRHFLSQLKVLKRLSSFYIKANMAFCS